LAAALFEGCELREEDGEDRLRADDEEPVPRRSRELLLLP
jgi:hypothetical protein